MSSYYLVISITLEALDLIFRSRVMKCRDLRYRRQADLANTDIIRAVKLNTKLGGR